jgi:SAM-dependent methyltransferase
MLHLPFSAQFDAAWLAASLLHIPKAIVPQALVELRRLLKPNGLIYISVKGGSGEVWQQDEGGRRFFAYYEAPELQNILASTGFMVFADWEKTIGKTRWLSLAARVV